jgi:polysaccharide biosynthesis/export protein
MWMHKSESAHQVACARAFPFLILSLFAAPLAHAQQSPAQIQAAIGEAAAAPVRRAALPEQSVLTAVPEGFEKLRLCPGYLLQMDVYDVPEMSTELRVDAQGYVTVPLIGNVRINGETVTQAQEMIAKTLVAREILKNPQVTLNVLQFSSTFVTVLGEVQNPGRIQLLASEPLGDVLALAGGETIAASSDIEIQHPATDGQSLPTHIKYVQGGDTSVLRGVQVDPGDTVVVHRAGAIYVLGAVNRPGGYLMVNGGTLSVVEAISLAGGTTIQASTRSAVIVRRQGDSFVQFKVPLAHMETGGAAPIQLQVNDALFVPLSTWKAVLVNGSNVLSAATSAAIYRAP